jgi:hypothetical protein
MAQGWIGVDWDGTVVHYEHWLAWDQFGPPLKPMVDRIRQWLKEGKDVRIVTARVRHGDVDGEFSCLTTGNPITNAMIINAIQDYCEKIIGARLPVQCHKDLNMIELWDDRAVQMVPNTGRTLAEEHEAELSALKGAP